MNSPAKKIRRKVCAVVLIILIVLPLAYYFLFLHVSPTVVIRNRTAREIGEIKLVVRGVGVRENIYLFRAEEIRPRSRTRARISSWESHLPYVNLVLLTEIGDEIHELVLGGYFYANEYGSFRINITEASDGTLFVDVRYRRFGFFIWNERVRREMEVAHDR